MSDPAKKLIKTSSLESVRRADGWANTLTGIGDATRDKTMSAKWVAEELDNIEIDELVEGSDMAARIVETLPEEMLREGWCVKIEGDPEAEEAVMARVDELEFNAKLQDALEDARAHGGAGLLLGAKDGARNLAQELDSTRLDDIAWLTSLPAYELEPLQWYERATEARYGEPMTYQIREETFSRTSFITPARGLQANLPVVHESRLLKFRGVRLNRRRTREKRGWGGSVLVRCLRVLQAFDQSWAGAANLLQDFSQAIMKLKGLTEIMEAGNEELVVRRAQLIDMSRSLARCVLLDEEESFERVATPLGGMPEMLQQFALRLSAAARMPVSKLMGQAPAGLNATGASDIRFWYDHVSAARQRQALPAINRFLQLLFRCKAGPTKGKEPENWSVKFNPLWQLTELEQADLRLKTAQADAAWITAQVITPSEAAISHFGGDEFNPNITIDTEARKGLTQPQLEDTHPDAPVKKEQALQLVKAKLKDPGAADQAEPARASELTSDEADREDAFDPNQPRDEHGMWAAGAGNFFHGTSAKFDRFDASRIGTATDEGHLGSGFYFSTDPNVVGKHHKLAMAVGLDVQNPLKLEMKTWAGDKRKLVRDALGLEETAPVHEVNKALRARGHDAVSLDYSPLGYKHRELMVMDPARITIRGVRDNPKAK